VAASAVQVCEIYFRVLKDAATPTHATGRPLLGATFSGLARVAHLIDYEVVADILEARAPD
jgi:nucleolar complex protein 3